MPPADAPESRLERLRQKKESRRQFAVREPRLSRDVELRAAFYYAALIALLATVLVVISATGAASPDADSRITLSFALGLVAACGIASGLTFLISLRHRILLISLSALLVAIGSILLEIGWLETVAKIVFAASAGLWIALMLTSIGQVMLIAAMIILVDFYSVFMGPTKKLVESGGPWIDYLTINLPAWGVNAVSLLGASDIIFFSLFIGSTLTFHLRRIATALAMTLSFVATMLVGLTLDIGVPALPLLSLAFLLANADLLYRRFLDEPDHHNDRPRGSGQA